jgi:hypothetical protein
MWMRVHRRLLEHYRQNRCGLPPPGPLIFSAWYGSNDFQKLRRWELTIEWAVHNGCTHILPEIPDDDFYDYLDDEFYVVDELSDDTYGWIDGGIHLPWTDDAKECPSPAELAKHLECLRAQWPTIADERIVQVTQPSNFTGCKARRLLVDVTGDAVPPWGDWTSLSRVEDERRTFTRFRAAINELIKPHHVDHVDFVIRCP